MKNSELRTRVAEVEEELRDTIDRASDAIPSSHDQKPTMQKTTLTPTAGKTGWGKTWKKAWQKS